MAMLFARASLPAWVVILAIGAFLAPAGIATTVLLVALGIACIPAVITAGVWKRTSSGGLKASGCHDHDYDGSETAALVNHEAAIDAEFTVEDGTPTRRMLR